MWSCPPAKPVQSGGGQQAGTRKSGCACARGHLGERVADGQLDLVVLRLAPVGGGEEGRLGAAATRGNARECVHTHTHTHRERVALRPRLLIVMLSLDMDGGSCTL